MEPRNLKMILTELGAPTVQHREGAGETNLLSANALLDAPYLYSRPEPTEDGCNFSKRRVGIV